jgi:hypothetical protein
MNADNGVKNNELEFVLSAFISVHLRLNGLFQAIARTRMHAREPQAEASEPAG